LRRAHAPKITIKPKVSAGADKSGIEAALKRHAQADAQKISVAVNGAEVTLSGRVPSWSERDTARHSAWGTPGVRSVVDKITIGF
jgi:osmotically-inducible protein OsmY